MRGLKELIQKKSARAPQGVDEKIIFHIAKCVLVEEYGARGGENIIPSYYKDKKLFLVSSSSLWMNEILLKQQYLHQQW